MLNVFRRKPPIKEILKNLIFRLRVALSRVQQNKLKLAEREKRLFKLVVEAHKANDIEKAKMYANEVAYIRKTLSRIEQASLELEAILLRLETLNEVGEYAAPLGKTLSYVLGLLRNVKYVGEVYPEFESLVESLRNVSGDVLGEPMLSNEYIGVDIDSLANNPEVGRILEEARTLVDIKRRELQDIAPDMYVERRVRLAEASGVGAVVTARTEKRGANDKMITVRVEKDSSKPLEELVYRWAVSHNGIINVDECAASLGVKPQDVLSTVKKLLREGRFKPVS